MSVVGRIIKDLKSEKVIKSYQDKGRLIKKELYTKLKNKHKCKRCAKNFKRLEIHHIKKISEGGTNEESNLMAVCHGCHEILDSIQNTNG